MTIKDISRHLFQPARRYSGLRMQQGRIILDADFNEAELIDDEDQRRALTDIIGPHGSPDDGFLIADPSVVAVDFTIHAGSYYIGGLRLDLETDETFLAQGDWLQSSRADVTLPEPPVAARDDLVYLVAWEQEVSAVEDQELLEQALGGDTSVRVRRMRRVQVLTDTEAECHEAFAALNEALIGDVHKFDAHSGELRSETRLTVTPQEDPGENEELCQAPASAGYVGADNQAIRVQVIAEDKFLWSYDNASPLSRIALPTEADTDVYTITFLSPPTDQAEHPLVGQVLELLPWGADLGNGEKTADHPIAEGIGGGLYARVKTPYDPTTGTLTVDLAGAALAPLLAWYAALDPELPRYLFLRPWNPGDSGGAIGITFEPATPVLLPGTGLAIAFSTAGLVGDYWIIAARPHTPALVVPWDLLDGALPHGPRRFYAPLGMLHWTDDGGLAVTTESCRRTFRPLTELGGCCTVTVGDGDRSFGDYRTITAALAALPPSGGKICVLAGIYDERVEITDRSDIVIEGCGERTILRTPEANDTAAGLITLTGCKRITIRDLVVEATAQIGIMLMPDSGGEQGPITLEDLAITTRRGPSQLEDPPSTALWLTTSPVPFPCPTIAAHQITRLQVSRCTLTMIGHYSAMPNVLLQEAVGSVLSDCKVFTPPPNAVAVSEAWGGIQLAGGCRNLEITRCEIRDGMGHGITLGNVVYGAPTPLTFSDIFTIGNPTVIDPGMDCPGVGGGIKELADAPSGEELETSPAAELRHISIVDNLIHDMHSSGIAVLSFWPEPDALDELGAFNMIHVHDLLIDHNRIIDNYRKPSEAVLDDERFFDVLAFGGIALASTQDLRIFDNRIVDNGENHLRPVCGVFVLHGENIDISRNLIKRNGTRVAGDGLTGMRAGIAVQMAGRRISYDEEEELEGVDPDGLEAAARIRGNTVLQPAGRSLQLYGLGPMVVEGNYLVSEGLTGTVPPASAHAVEIINLGQSPELIADGSMPSFFGFLPQPPIQGDPEIIDERLMDGRILYTKNQVRLKVFGPASANMECAVRLLSYGDVLMRGNQHVTTFDRDIGHLTFSTMAIGWSVNAVNNRSEDTHLDNSGETLGIITDVSIIATGAMVIVAMNIATRCILGHAVGTSALTDPKEHKVNNIVYYDPGPNCDDFWTLVVYWLTFIPG